MSALTAIELGADTCVLVKAVVRGTEVRVSGVETLDPSSFPGADAFAGALKQARKSHGLPRRARIVLWGMPEGAKTTDPSAAPLLAPLKRAGFRLDRVVSPCNALAALARVRQPKHDAAVAWLAVNRSGVAISVIRPGEQLFAHSFEWDSSVGSTGSQARLLQRYSLVSYLAPEIRRGIEEARTKGWRVDAVVTCGNLPDLRSLTMPLIEELDLEVETLDSLDGLDVKPGLKDTLTESAPAIRIACAGALARGARLGKAVSGERFRGGAVFRAAALVIAAAGIGWLWYSARTPAPMRTAAATAPPAKPQLPPPVTPAPPVKSQPPVTPATTAVKPQPQPPPVTTATPVKPQPQPAVTPAIPVKPRPQPSVAPPIPVKQQPQPSVAASAPVKQQQPPVTPPPHVVKQPPPKAQVNPPVVAKVPPATTPATLPPKKVEQQPARTDKADVQQAQLVPLAEPIPRITTILVSQDRKFAMLEGGRVVTVGETIGTRVVSAIEPRAVVLREPSGVQIRVGLGGRLMGVEKGR